MEKQKTRSQTNEYKAETAKRLYDRFMIYVPKGQRNIIKQKAEERGMSLNGFIKAAIEEYINKQ